MKFVFSILFILTFVQFSRAQSNLVLNPSFEEYDSCWPGIAGIPYGNVHNWSSPNLSTSDFFSDYSYLGNFKCGYDTGFTTVPQSVFGFEYAHHGECYGGFLFYDGPVSNSYEYVQASLLNPLVFGQTYILECYVSLGFEGQSLCTSNLGFYFSDTQLSVSNFANRLNYMPQYENPDSNLIICFKGWQRISGSFVASGGEKFMSIGMFKPYSMANVDTCNTYPDGISYTYLFLDDVAVYDTAKTDSIKLCMNDSVQLGGIWQHTEGLYFDTIAGLPVKFYISLTIC